MTGTGLETSRLDVMVGDCDELQYQCSNPSGTMTWRLTRWVVGCFIPIACILLGCTHSSCQVLDFLFYASHYA